MDLRIPFSTLLKIALTFLLFLSVVKLWPVIILMFIAVLVAVMLDPGVRWMQNHGARKGMAIALVAVVMFGFLVAFFVFMVPSIAKQATEMAKDLPRLVQRIPYGTALMRNTAGGSEGDLVKKGLFAGAYVLQGLTAVVFVLVVAMYLLVEGVRAYQWLASFAPAAQRMKLDRTMNEMQPVVLAFMRGQFITSAMCALFVFGLASALRLPMPLLLATIAFVADFVPVIGTIAMTAPAVALALTISPARAAMAVAGYLLYHLLENYVIIPRVYGSQMRLSTLTVLVSIAIGGTLQGVIGAVLALPVAAAYPIIERIWLREHLPSADTVPRHEAIETTPSS